MSVSANINGEGGSTQQLASYNDWANLNFKGGLIGAGIPMSLEMETLVPRQVEFDG